MYNLSGVSQALVVRQPQMADSTSLTVDMTPLARYWASVTPPPVSFSINAQVLFLKTRRGISSSIEKILRAWVQSIGEKTCCLWASEAAILRQNLEQTNEKPFEAWIALQKELESPGDFLLWALEQPDLFHFASSILLKEEFWLIQESEKTGKLRLEELMLSRSFNRSFSLFFENLIRTHPHLCSLTSSDGTVFIDWLIKALERCMAQPEACASFWSETRSKQEYITFYPGLETLKRVWEEAVHPFARCSSPNQLLEWVCMASKISLNVDPCFKIWRHGIEEGLMQGWMPVKDSVIQTLLLRKNQKFIPHLIGLSSGEPQAPPQFLSLLKILHVGELRFEEDKETLIFLGEVFFKNRTRPSCEATIPLRLLDALPDDAPFFAKVACKKLCRESAVVDAVEVAAIESFEAPLAVDIVSSPEIHIKEYGWEHVLKSLGSNSLVFDPSELEERLLAICSVGNKPGPHFFETASFLYCVKNRFYKLAFYMIKNREFRDSLTKSIASESSSKWVKALASHFWKNPKSNKLLNELLKSTPKLFSYIADIQRDWIEQPIKHFSREKARAIYACEPFEAIANAQMQSLVKQHDWSSLLFLIDEAPVGFYTQILAQTLNSSIAQKKYLFFNCLLTRYASAISVQNNEQKSWLHDWVFYGPILEVENSLKILDRELGHEKFKNFLNTSGESKPSLTMSIIQENGWERVSLLLKLDLFAPQDTVTEASPLRLALQAAGADSVTARKLLLEYKNIFSAYCARTGFDGLSDLEYMLLTESVKLVKTYIDTCSELGFVFFRPLYLQIFRHLRERGDLAKMLVFLENTAPFMHHISSPQWQQIISQFVANEANHIYLEPLAKLLKAHFIHLNLNSSAKQAWVENFIVLQKRAFGENLLHLRQFVARMATLLEISPVQQTATILVTPCSERDDLLRRIQDSHRPKTWIDPSTGLSLLHYLCREENSSLKTETIERLLTVKTIKPLAFVLDHLGNTPLHILFEKSDLLSFRAYLQIFPSAILAPNGKNQSCLQLISVYENPLITVCAQTLQPPFAKDKICSDIFNHGIRFGYMPSGQLELLGISSLKPEDLWFYFITRAQLPHLIDNPLAQIYFCPFSFEHLHILSASSPEQLNMWLEEVKTNPYLFAFAKDLLGWRNLSPSITRGLLSAGTNTFSPAVWFSQNSFDPASNRSWKLNVVPPHDFLVRLEESLLGCVAYLNTQERTSELQALLNEHEISGPEVCPNLCQNLIARLTYNLHVKGLSPNETERELYYSRLKQVLFLIFEASKDKPYEEYLGNWLSILATGGLCALSLEDLKMLVCPFANESHSSSQVEVTASGEAIVSVESSEEGDFSSSIADLAAEYRMCIVEMMAGRHLESNVHAKNGLIAQLSAFGVELEFNDPFVGSVPFQSYCNVDQRHVFLLARQQNHVHGLVRFWINRIKANDTLRFLTLKKLTACQNPHSLFGDFSTKTREFLSAHFIFSEEFWSKWGISDTPFPSTAHPIEAHTSWPEDLQDIFSNFGWAEFFHNNSSLTFPQARDRLMKQLLEMHNERQLWRIVYLDDYEQTLNELEIRLREVEGTINALQREGIDDVVSGVKGKDDINLKREIEVFKALQTEYDETLESVALRIKLENELAALILKHFPVRSTSAGVGGY